MAVYYKSTKMTKMNHKSVAVKVWNHKGTEVYKAERAIANQSGTKTSDASYGTGAFWGNEISLGSFAGFDNFTCTYNITTGMGSVPNENGVSSESHLYLKFNDGSMLEIASHYGTLFAAGSTYTKSGTVTVNMSGKNDTQKSNVKLAYCLSNMYAATPKSENRHDFTFTITNAKIH